LDFMDRMSLQRSTKLPFSLDDRNSALILFGTP
jgi:hypothetical protein